MNIIKLKDPFYTDGRDENSFIDHLPKVSFELGKRFKPDLCIYCYESMGYAGEGNAILVNLKTKQMLHISLEHCTYFGPLDNPQWQKMTVDEYLSGAYCCNQYGEYNADYDPEIKQELKKYVNQPN